MQDFTPPPDALAGRIILVTGAGSGLGRAAAKAYAGYGATLILLGRTLGKLEQVYDEIQAAGNPEPAIFPLDLETATATDYAGLAATLEREFGTLHGLLHSAAVLGVMTPLAHYDSQVWLKVMQVNLNAPFLLTQACLPLLHNAGRGSIVFTLDSKDRAYWGAYGVSKAALRSLMHVLAHELDVRGSERPQCSQPTNGTNLGIRVNGINPGPTRTRLRALAYPGELPTEIPEPESKMATYLFLMAEASSGLTGRCFDAQSLARLGDV